MRSALIVRGGADFHDPVGTTDSFLPYLDEQGFTVRIAEDLAIYDDAALLARTDLVINCWTAGGDGLTPQGADNLDRSVRAGTGLAGWHGGIVAAFTQRRYQWLTGAWFVCHPGNFAPHTLTVLPRRAGYPIVAGIDRVQLDTERYWVLADPLNDVLATITFPVEQGQPWHDPVTHPAVWTRRWGAGRIFVSTVGHHLPDLDIPEIRTLTERGLSWAARTGPRYCSANAS